MAPRRSRNLRSLFAMAMAGLLVMAFIGPATADMQSPSGDPQADGWAFNGNSLEAGVYVRGTGDFSYDIYTTAFTLESDSDLVGNGWSASDEIVGIGGVIDLDADNPNLTHSVRIVSKFSAGNDGWFPAANGTGSGSFSGSGGEGALLLATLAPGGGHGEHLNPFAYSPWNRVASIFQAGEIYEIPMLLRNDGTSTPAIDTEAGKFIYQRGGDPVADTATGEEEQLLSSWQVFVNVSMLVENGYAEVPKEGDAVIQTLQRSSGVFTDGYGIIQTPEDPEPEVRQDCLDGGWQDFGFSNQGQCLASLNANDNSVHGSSDSNGPGASGNQGPPQS